MITTKCLVINCNAPAIANGLCDKHRKRVERHGHAEQTRPADWGAREKHPLYRVHCHLMRHHRQRCYEPWLDFWKFVADIGKKPPGARFKRRDEAAGFGPENWFWRTPITIRQVLGQRSEYMRAWSRRVEKENPDYFKSKYLKRHYGVTLEWYRSKLEEQAGACAICEQPESLAIRGKRVHLAVDHDRKTGKARGLLCAKCNQGIGCLDHNAERLRKAIEYLNTT